MMKIRRYLRGSGRVLAFVFIASVIWLLFDMAALRISLNDVNSQLIKERVRKDKEVIRQQATRGALHVSRGFKHPVQRLDLAGTPAGKEPLNAGSKLAQVYRNGGKRHERVVEERKPQGGSIIKLEPIGSVEKNKAAAPTSKSSAKYAVKFEPNETKSASVKAEKVTAPVKVPSPVLVSNQSKVSPIVGETKLASLPTSNRSADKHEDMVQGAGDHIDSEVKEKVKNELEAKETKESQSTAEVAHPVETTPKAVDQDVKGKEVNIIKQVETLAQADLKPVGEPVKPTIKPKLQTGENSKDKPVVPKDAGVHKVLSLDVTLAPRNSKSMGQFGQAGIISSDKEQEVKKRWDEGHFNVFLSDQIPLDRAIPDSRPQICAQCEVHNDLPSTSVIFCFVDEVWSTLLRSVHSVLNRSPPHLLEEILLVDDCSTKDYLGEQLDVYMSKLPKVRIIRLKERQGLIRARLAGAAAAKGEVLTFLDSHIECNVGWLEPLLERVYLDRKKVPCPVIDVISDKDLSYAQVDSFQRGVFKWPLEFGWRPLPEDYIKKNNITASDPFRCPVMAGGLFSIDKKYFYELGTYDSGLDIWGGENMEISFKIWMCGGQIEIVPCSRVGHIFRGKNPYKFPKDMHKTVKRNLARVAEVWLDEYKYIFYGHGYQRTLDTSRSDVGNLTEQIELRKKLQCKSFKWYLDNVYPDLHAPLVKADGLIFNRGLRKCLAQQKGSLSFETCDLSEQSQHFNYTWMRRVRHHDLCFVPQGKEAVLSLQSCDIKPELRWFHDASNPELGEHFLAEFLPGRMCLEAGLQGEETIRLNACSDSAFQKWQFSHYYSL
ncbi:polypeptide N-acetylgalactosaminyltransferase 5 [Genypterus blacodes]|uniref:polypeptide N-acetylgalactosaminyltransferase 5 n=1 Tax=Genypterus blacodes TaxID=154954 RepID=UPI003F772AAD